MLEEAVGLDTLLAVLAVLAVAVLEQLMVLPTE
jgi:hypothetical protein